MDQFTFNYLLRIADNNLILGQRLAEWCGHGPVLEEDIAMTNISLDLIGQATLLYEHLAAEEGAGKSGDDIAFLRDAPHFYNVQLVEMPNGDFAQTMARQFFFSAFYALFLEQLKTSKNDFLVAFAHKASKEVAYHLRHSADWLIRLGDGTAESHQRAQEAVNNLWPYTGEILTPDALDREMAAAGIGPDLQSLAGDWNQKIRETLADATLQIPQNVWMHLGGKSGSHTEHLGYILAEMQFLPRAYPGLKW